MISRGFKPVGWVAAIGGAALGCYMLSLNVAAERADLARVNGRIVTAEEDIRSLQTELGTRGRLAQLDRWNADVLALAAPAPAQFVKDEVTLARFDRREATIEDQARVRMASLETVPPAPAAAAPVHMAAADYTAAGAADVRPLVRRAAYVPADGKPLRPVAAALIQAPVAKASLIDDKIVADIGAASRSERHMGGAAGR